MITDLELAPRNASGKVEYSMDIFILKPIDLKKGNHKLLLDFNNRGEMRVGALNDAALSNNPTKAADAGTGFIMNLGYSDRRQRVGFRRDERRRRADHFRSGREEPGWIEHHRPLVRVHQLRRRQDVRYELAYPAATLDKSKATLTVRARLDDQPTDVPASGWEYVDEYGHPPAARRHPVQAKPRLRVHVHGEGSGRRRARTGGDARSRVLSAPRRERRAGTPNPLAGDVQHTFSFSISQPSRTLNDFQALGFNEDEQGRRVIDGMLKLDRRRQRRSNQLSVRADRQNRAQPSEPPVPGRRVPVRLSGVDRSSQRQDRRAQRALHGEQHLPQELRRQFRQRILGQGRFAAAHRHARQGFAGPGERALLS